MCSNAPFRIYVDAVINHMSYLAGTGSAGSSFNSSTKLFPGVPYGPNDFTGRYGNMLCWFHAKSL